MPDFLLPQDPALHTELALTYIDEVLSFVADDATSKLWRAKGACFPLPCKHGLDANLSPPSAASYASSPNPSPFLAYFEATTPTSPAKHARLRTALFLQTSSAYDASEARARLAPHAPLLAPELAIIAGKVRRVQNHNPPPRGFPSLLGIYTQKVIFLRLYGNLAR